MSEGTSNSIVNLGDLTKPATVLIEKISDAVGGLFAPHQIKRIAKAEAEADLIKAKRQIEVTDLHRRAMHRFIEEEAHKQQNMESIVEKALPLLDEDESTKQQVDNDWIVNFFEKCRTVSDEDMQQLWAKILASEANEPDKFCKKTVNLLSDLGSSDAQLFTQLCGFCFQIGNAYSHPLIFNFDDAIYTSNGIKFSSLRDLETLGLIKMESVGFHRYGLTEKQIVKYFDRTIELSLNSHQQQNLQLGMILFTRFGQELSSVCAAEPVEGFFDYILARWRQKGLVLPRDEEDQEPADQS